jgi:hypothetical protein
VEFDFDADVGVLFFEDLTYPEVAPLLDALAGAGVFRVRASRDGWSGPAAGGPEVGLIVTAALAVGAAAFAKTFAEELAKDSYKAVRAAIGRLARRLRERQAEQRRAVQAVVLDIAGLRFFLGHFLHDPADPDEWSEAWMVLRLRRAQAAIDALPPELWERPLHELRHEAEMDETAQIARPIETDFGWDDEAGEWVPNESLIQLLAWWRQRRGDRSGTPPDGS